MNSQILTRQTVKLGHRQRATMAQVWTGGSGPPLVLLHGAWAGARAHWLPVWDTLARHHRVIAPELPGIVRDSGSGDPKGHIADYADWVVDLLDTLQVDKAAVAGNSFGAAVAWYLAVQHPARCSALALLDGGPPPPLNGLLRGLLLNSALARRFAQSQLRQRVYSLAALRNAFHDASKVPDEVRYALGSPDERTVAQMLGMALRSAVPAALPRQPVLIVWGADDHLPGSGVDTAQALHQQLPGSRLLVVDGAGHLPQVEQPQAVLDALLPFLALAPVPAN
jgi:pimeloyl-ACP methyl ester carboxylesterase